MPLNSSRQNFVTRGAMLLSNVLFDLNTILSYEVLAVIVFVESMFSTNGDRVHKKTKIAIKDSEINSCNVL